MSEARNYYENAYDKDEIRRVYSSDKTLEAKYKVMRQYGINAQTFEEWTIDQLQITGDETVLDIGTGSGRFILPIARILKQGTGCAIGCDLSGGVMLSAKEIAETNELPALFLIGDAEDIPFLSNQFDLVMANHMLYHVPDLHRAIVDAKRVLKPNGRFLATTNSVSGMPVLYTLHVQTMKELNIPYEAGIDKLSFSLENGHEHLSKAFNRVEMIVYDAGFQVNEPEPVLDYYIATQLYQGPYNNQGIEIGVRSKIAETFRQLTVAAIETSEGILNVSKPVAAFICKD